MHLVKHEKERSGESYVSVSTARIEVVAKNLLRSNSYLYGLKSRVQPNGPFERRVVQRGDDAVIEGFPRSGNTFATTAFGYAQNRQTTLGNHCHASAQLHRARRFDVPAMVVVRDPKDAALSMLVYRGAVSGSADTVLRDYINFYRSALQISDFWVPAPFLEVISDFGSSIRRLNYWFGTSFDEYRGDDASDDVVRKLIGAKREKIERELGEALPLSRSTLPDAAKAASRPIFEDQLKTESAKRLLEIAQEVYARVLVHPSLSIGLPHD